MGEHPGDDSSGRNCGHFGEPPHLLTVYKWIRYRMREYGQSNLHFMPCGSSYRFGVGTTADEVAALSEMRVVDAIDGAGSSDL